MRTTQRRWIRPLAVAAIAAVMPVDQAVEPAVFAMAPDGDPGAVIASHVAVGEVLATAEDRAVSVEPVERTAFYGQAKAALRPVPASTVWRIIAFIMPTISGLITRLAVLAAFS